jgi:hypothetical protein
MFRESPPNKIESETVFDGEDVFIADSSQYTDGLNVYVTA